MKKNYIEAMNEYSEAEKKPVKYPKYDPPTAGRRAGEPDPDEKNSILSGGKAGDKPGLWENIQKKKEKMGKNYKPAKPGDPDRPDPEALKKAQTS